jgi:cephalosporin hydroxylase
VIYRAQQNEAELAEYVNVLRHENIRSYLEIGCKWGGTLFRVAQVMPKGSKIVALDMPNGDTIKSLRSCITELKLMGYDATLLIGDSTDEAMIAQVKKLAPFDACLIDANHTLPYVTADFENYGPLATIVAFHDISYYRKVQPGNRMPIEVPVFWNEVKTKYRHIEIKHDPADNGFGILYRGPIT